MLIISNSGSNVDLRFPRSPAECIVYLLILQLRKVALLVHIVVIARILFWHHFSRD